VAAIGATAHAPLAALYAGAVVASPLTALCDGLDLGLGLLLLAGAYAWQRVRPRATPDLRGVPHAVR
jgi:hypothetical protein